MYLYGNFILTGWAEKLETITCEAIHFRGVGSLHMGSKKQVILHISDLHFSAKCNEQDLANRKLLFDGLLYRLKTIENEWRPTLVCVTGDITDKGQPEGFNDAEVWLKQLSLELKIDITKFLLTPGNHDCVRDQQICPKLIPSTSEEADSLLKFSTPPYLQDRFKAFSDFCKNIGIHPYKLGETDSYLIGSREIDGIQFIACNTAWFSWEQNEQGKLWLGLEILRYLESNKQLVCEGTKTTEKISIALMHHGTAKCFHPLESEDRGGNRPPSLSYLWKRSHLALYGHSHENALDAPDQQKAHCWVVRAGATNAGANFPNNVNLIRLSNTGFELRTLEYNPADAGSLWNKSSAAKAYNWMTAATQQLSNDQSTTKQLHETPIELIRERAVKYAAEVIINKSRQIKPRGNLPEQISLQVALKPESESDTEPFSPTPSTDKPKLSCMTIDEAVFRSRLTILFGDLGAGKSTLLATLAEKIGDKVPKCLPLFIPAPRLEVSANDGADKLIAQIDSFMATDLNAGGQWSYKRILDDGYELLLLADGLDEIDKKSAIHLIRLLANLPEVYSRVTVVLSSRFSEVAGINFERWQICQVLQVDASQKEVLFKNEALAQGSEEAESASIANKAKLALENNPPLNTIANTPLAVRLLYPSLVIESSTLQERTLGDLLYELLLQRLGDWAEKDVKSTPLTELESAFPTPEYRAIIMGELAFNVLEKGTLSRITAIETIKKHIHEDKRSHADLIAKQFLDFLEDAGIMAGNESINFIYQPLAQISAGVFLAKKVQENSSIEIHEIELWRVVSFAGTMIRRMNCLDDARDWFNDCITIWMKERRGIAPSCYVCDELRDTLLAQRLVELLPQLKRRPLWYLEEERAASTQAIAITLVLAGNKGFDWLYSEYLDLRMPPTNYGSALIGSLYGKWALLVKPLLTSVQQQRLTELVPPLLATSPPGTYGFLECLAYLVPDAFEQTQYLWLVAGQLDNPHFYRWAKEQLVHAFSAGKQDVVNSILERKPGKEGALLWIEFNSEKKLPASILRALLSAKWSSQMEEHKFAKALESCQSQLGQNRWRSFMRWCLTDQDHGVAASAALELLGQGETSFYLLGNALSKVLDTGGLGNKAETAMRRLVAQATGTEINWVSCLFGNTDRTIGARAGSWRILLEALNAGLDNGPDLLAGCIDAIGPYNLPRYPDVRLAFQTLLTGQNGREYRKDLRNALNHYNPSERHAAAMILTVSCPHDEGLALITAVSFVGHRYRSDYWEWDKFLVTLNFGPSVLESLNSALSTFNPKARSFGLALLLRHGLSLSEHDKRELLLSSDWQIRQLLESMESSDFGLKSDFARNVLVNELESRSLPECKHIAESLLKFHREHLSDVQRAKCFVATINDQIGWWLSFDDLINQLKIDTNLFKEIVSLRKKTSPQDFPKLLQHMIGPDGGFNVLWDELLWDLFCSDHKLMSHREDDIGLELFWLGKRAPEYGVNIGKAAANLLDDERIQKHRWTNHFHWLAVLADEFVGLEKNKLKEITCIGSHFYGAATTSLLKRLGEIPSEFTVRDRHNSVPKNLFNKDNLSSQTSLELRDKLLNSARESEWLKPDIEALITSALLEYEVTQEFLDELAAKGNNGCLMAGVFAFCCELDIRADYAISFINYFEPHDRQNSAALNRLKSVAMLSQYALTRLNSTAKGEYVSALIQAINREEHNKGHYFYELLRLEKSLTPDQIDILLPYFAQNKFAFGLNRQTVHLLSEWVRNLTDTATKDKLIKVCPICFESLDMGSWDDESLNTHSPAVLLFFPLLYWAIGGEPDEKGLRIFARAIKLMFHHRSYSNVASKPQQYEIIQSVSPLLSCVPQHILRKALEQLMDFPEPEVRMWVQLFHCFVGQ